MNEPPRFAAGLGHRPAWLPWLYAAGGLIAAVVVRSIDGSAWAVAGAALGGVIVSGVGMCVVAHVTGRDADWDYGIHRYRMRASRHAGDDPGTH